MALDLDGLRRFLASANSAGYASGDPRVRIREGDGSVSIRHTDGDWAFHDNFFGGEPFGGRTVVSLKSAPVFLVTYYGGMSSPKATASEVYRFLRNAMLQAPEVMPIRGPAMFRDESFEYRNRWRGDITRFVGAESIRFRGHQVYQGHYAGGLVAQYSD